jgi:hypothetical protein
MYYLQQIYGVTSVQTSQPTLEFTPWQFLRVAYINLYRFRSQQQRLCVYGMIPVIIMHMLFSFLIAVHVYNLGEFVAGMSVGIIFFLWMILIPTLLLLDNIKREPKRVERILNSCSFLEKKFSH